MGNNMSGKGLKQSCGSCCSSPFAALIVAGILFGLMALLHLYRAIVFFPVVIGTMVVPQNASIAFFIILALLSAWMFWSACKYCCKE